MGNEIVNETNKSKEKKPSPPSSGLAVAGTLWIWGFLLMYAPTYLNIVGWWEYPFYILGFIVLLISLVGTFTELGKLSKSEGMSYLGVSLVFLLPALALYLLEKYHHIASTLVTLAKITILLLFAIGISFVFFSMSHFFWKKESLESSIKSPEQIAVSKIDKAKPTLEIIANIFVAMLALATAIVTLVEKFIR